tara:strand:+ start:1147 stop:2235 length:1089 start_codon:yes stop_codon:yes gene_type:complete
MAHPLASYQLDSIPCSLLSTVKYVEICAKLIDGVQEDIHELITDTTTLYIQGDLKGYDDPVVGYDPASNFRDRDKTLNEQIVVNWMNLFEVHQRVRGKEAGIVCTSIPRSERYFTVKMEENGKMKVYNNTNNSVNTESTKVLQNFLDYVGLNERRVLNIREASKGAKYRTYFADLQALLLAVDFRVFPEMFEKVFLKPTLVRKGDNELMPDGSVKPILRERELPGGNTWTPKDLTYLYFVKSSPVGNKHCPHSQCFYVPKSGVISKIYYQLDELLKNEENAVKRMIREKYFLSICEWTRWSDYFVNDVDDVITILAIRHAFSFTYLTPSEKVIKDKLDSIVKPWVEHFASQELLDMEPEPEY